MMTKKQKGKSSIARVGKLRLKDRPRQSHQWWTD
jgi:hypothetical protein